MPMFFVDILSYPRKLFESYDANDCRDIQLNVQPNCDSPQPRNGGMPDPQPRHKEQVCRKKDPAVKNL